MITAREALPFNPSGRLLPTARIGWPAVAPEQGTAGILFCRETKCTMERAMAALLGD